MKNFDGIIWTRENILPILKKVVEEYYSEPDCDKRGVRELRTYYNYGNSNNRPFIKGWDGKLHCPWVLTYTPPNDCKSWRRNAPNGLVHINCNVNNDFYSTFFEELSETEKDKLLEILNDKSYREKAEALEREYQKQVDAFMEEYNALCDKYGIEWECDDPYCGLNLVDRK